MTEASRSPYNYLGLRNVAHPVEGSEHKKFQGAF
jgi:hypothetical protein